MYFFKTLISSFINSFKIFWKKDLIELLYLAYTSFGQLYYNLTILLLHAFILLALLLTKTSTFTFLLLFWLLNFDCLLFLRPSVDHKNYKYFFSYLLEALKIFSIFLTVFFVPYAILHFDIVPIGSLTFILFMVLFILFVPYKFSAIKIFGSGFLAFFCLSIFVGFKNLIHHFLLMGYLNFERILEWILYIFMFDKQLFQLLNFAGFIASPIIVYITLGMLDSKKTFYCQMCGLFRGLKMFFLNYPISFVWFNLYRFLVIYTYKFFSIIGFSNNFLLAFLYIFFYYFYLSFLTNIYVKKVHEEFLVYF